MKIGDLVKGTDYEVLGDINTEVTDLCYDSRKVKNGSLFFCIKGFTSDGHKYASMAVESGASCLVVSEKQNLEVAQIVVDDTREAMAVLSAAFYGNPSEKLMMIGVTGTNGKTTSTYMLKKILEKCGKKTGLIGTIECVIGDKVIPSERTTPESMDLQRILSDMVAAGCDSVVMEVSSHSLYLKRVFGIKFSGAIFTNLTQDHLDFHKTMDNYADAKAILFENSDKSVINADDAYSEIMISHSENGVFFGINTKNACYLAEDISLHEQGSDFTVKHGGDKLPVSIKIPGLFNVYNALGAISLALELGFDAEKVKCGIESVKKVPGRFQSLDTHGKGFSVILDYSHTPDSLEKALKTIREFAKRRIICVFGCGGNRDNGKRPIMGEISGKFADFTVITSDNPRFENPEEIINQILKGIEKTDAEYVTVQDRREAIKYALTNAENGDIILLAGKGHEDYQEICGEKHPFDEAVIVEELMSELYPAK